MKKPFAITVYAAESSIYGSTFERTYLRPTKSKMSKRAFTAWAIGDLLMLIAEGEFYGLRDYVINNVIVLTPEEAYEHWVKQADAEIAQQTAVVRDYMYKWFRQ